MIVATYNSSDDHGGAAKAAFRLNEALRGAGVAAFLLCRHKRTRSEYAIRVTERRSEYSIRVAQFERFWSQTARQFLIAGNRSGLSSTIFTVDPLGLDVTEVPFATVARIHHLHWCHGFISPAVVGRLRMTKRPLFLTLHDQWWMTGGCHYSAGCGGYENRCESCPQLIADPGRIVSTALAEKRDAYGFDDVTVIAPSRWMADCARRSAVFRNADIHVVRNPIDLSTFAPLPADQRAAARAELGLEENDVGILFGAQVVDDRRKGFPLLVDALKQIQATCPRPLTLISFGRPAQSAPLAASVPAINLGEISDDRQLARVYAAADLFVIPSLEDNYPNTVVEALACGTPVVGFAAGGICDLVDGSTTGLVARPVGSVPDLAHAILAGIEKFAGNFEARKACRAIVADGHDSGTIAARMLDLYAARAPDFRRPLDKEEEAVVRTALARNREGKSAFARLDSGSRIFTGEAALGVLLPLFTIHEAAEAQNEAIRREADLRVQPDEYRPAGRGQNAVRHLGAGWAPPDQNGVWNSSRDAHLHFFLPAGMTVHGIDLQLSGVDQTPRRVSLSQDGKRRASFEVRGKRQQTFHATLPPVIGPRYFNLTLSLPAAAPGESGGETRRVCLGGITLRSVDSGSRTWQRIAYWIRRWYTPRAPTANLEGA